LATLLLLTAICGTIVAFRSLLHAADDAALASWALKEDGLFESAGAICCLAAAVLFGLAAISRSLSRLARVCLFAMATLTGVMFLEELSWGQRLLNLQTPQWLARENLAGEVNLHNLRIFGADRDQNVLQVAWYAAMILYLGAAPLLAAHWHRREAGDGLTALLPPRFVAVAFVAAGILLFVVGGMTTGDEHYRGQELPELFELLCEFLLLVTAAALWQRRHRQKDLPWAIALVSLAVVPLAIALAWDALPASLNQWRSQGVRTQGDYLLLASRPDAALQKYQAALALDPRNAGAHVRLASVLLSQGAWQDAADHLRAAIALEPQRVELRKLLAALLESQGLVREAHKELIAVP
jgi:tetratricopeptide (TPR) repeat protein